MSINNILLMTESHLPHVVALVPMTRPRTILVLSPDTTFFFLTAQSVVLASCIDGGAAPTVGLLTAAWVGGPETPTIVLGVFTAGA